MALVFRQHQTEGLQFILGNGRLGGMLWHEMGLGKTVVSLEAARTILGHLRSQGVRNPKFLVVMPKSASSTWRKECMDNYPDLWQSMVMLPYSRMHEEAQILAHQDIRVLIIDEYHYLKNPKSLRMEMFAKMLKNISNRNGQFWGGKVIPLTGTPMPNNAGEWFSTWSLLAAQNLSMAADWLMDRKRYSDWCGTFSRQKTTAFGTSLEGVQNTDQMTQLIAPFVHFRKAIECLDMHEKNEIAVDLGIPDDKLLADANIDEPEAYMALLERLSRAKAPHMMEWVKNFIATTDKQLVMFSMYLEPIYNLQAKHPKDVVIMTGAESTKERESNVLKFQQGKVRVIAMSYATGAESLNLQNAHTALYLGYPWTDGKLKQAMARIWRQGQKEPTFHYFLTSGYNDARILGLVRSKEEATTEVEQSLQLLEEQNRLLKNNIPVINKNELDSLFY